jgi:DNA-binding CsgD family transcriptional regulator
MRVARFPEGPLTPDSSQYQLPLPVLRGFLEPSTPIEFELPRPDGTHRRVWRCGCSAQYRDSTHQTASWFPCATHDAALPERRPHTPSAPASPDVLSRRLGPTFCIIDSDLTVLCKSPGADVEGLLAHARSQIAAVVASGEAAAVPLEDDAILRIVPLRGAQSDTFAVLVERQRARGNYAAAAKRYALTRREVDVLRLIIANHTTTEIAGKLCISETTVSDHVKGLFRKTGCNRRTELLTKLFLN